MDQLRVRAYLDVLLGQDTAATTRAGAAAAACAASPGCAVAAAPNARGPQEPHDPGQTGPGTAAPPRAGQAGPEGPRPGTADGPPVGPARAAGGHGGADQPDHPAGHPAEAGGPAREAAGFGPVDADLARAIVANAAADPATTWCLTITDPGGHPTAHGCARPARPRGHRAGRTSAAGTRAATQTRATAAGHTSQTHPATRPPGTRPSGIARDRHRSTRLRRGSAEPASMGPGGSGHVRWPGPDRRPGTDRGHRLRPPARHRRARPGRPLRHLVEIRDGECTCPPCRRDARRCDFEHAVPWEARRADLRV